MRQVTGVAYGKSVYPRYDAAELGFRGYWYPALFSSALRRRPVPLTLLGERVALFRDRGRVRALADRCPHRGIPLSEGRQEFPGTYTCPYHGWTFDLETGRLVAVLTDGPDSPICGKAGVKTYPVAERAGIVWIHLGEAPPPPVEEDIPEELLRPDCVLVGRLTDREGDWRHAAENGFDEGHAKYLHRTALWMLPRHLPTWSETDVHLTEDGRWVTYTVKKVGFEADYPGLGRWPRYPWWRRVRGGPSSALRLPGVLRIGYSHLTHYEWYVPTVPGRHRYLQLLATWERGWERLTFRTKYWLYRRWLFHVAFNNQDLWMVRLMETPPEQLYRPDTAIVGWRRHCEQFGGRGPQPFDDPGRPVAAVKTQGG